MSLYGFVEISAISMQNPREIFNKSLINLFI